MISLKDIRKKKPKFRRQEYHKRKRLQKVKWRRPKGFHSKLRVFHKSKGKRVKVGYGSPKKFRGLHISGKEIVLVHTLTELKSLKKETQIAVLSRVLGTKKRLVILNEAKKLGIVFDNIKDTDAYITNAEKRLGLKKAKRKAKAEKKKAKKKKPKKEKKAEEPKEEKKAEEKPKEEKVEEAPVKEPKKEEKPKEKKEEKPKPKKKPAKKKETKKKVKK